VFGVIVVVVAVVAVIVIVLMIDIDIDVRIIIGMVIAVTRVVSDGGGRIEWFRIRPFLVVVCYCRCRRISGNFTR